MSVQTRSAQLPPAIGMYQTAEHTETTINANSLSKLGSTSVKRNREIDGVTSDMPPKKKIVPNNNPQSTVKLLVLKSAVTNKLKECECVVSTTEKEEVIQALDKAVHQIILKAVENAKLRNQSAGKPRILARDFTDIVH